jgi:hypothetical protein
MNPELQRNLWLEASPRRIGWAATAFLGVLAAVWLSSDGRTASEQLQGLGGAGIFIFFAWPASRSAPRSANAPGISSACPRSTPGP